MSKCFVVLFAFLSGCALWPLTEADCKVASWQQRGYDDGYFGHLPQDMRLAPGVRVNLEVDLIARYVERVLAEK